MRTRTYSILTVTACMATWFPKYWSNIEEYFSLPQNHLLPAEMISRKRANEREMLMPWYFIDRRKSFFNCFLCFLLRILVIILRLLHIIPIIWCVIFRTLRLRVRFTLALLHLRIHLRIRFLCDFRVRVIILICLMLRLRLLLFF